MEGDKRRTKDDTWKSDELKKHLKVSRSDSQSEDGRHRQRKSREGDSNDADDLPKDQEKVRVKLKEKAGEKVKLIKSSDVRHKNERKEKGRENDHPREHEREKVKLKHVQEEKHNTGKSGERHSGKERERKHKKDDPNQTLMENAMEALGERDKEHRRRDSKDHADPPKVKDEERERKHTDRKNEESRDTLGEVSTHKGEEREHRHKSHKERDPDKERRRHREKKEHELFAVEGKEKFLKLRSLTSVRDGEEGHTSRKHKEQSHYEDRHHRENSERQHREENEKKKKDHKHREHKSQGKSSRHEAEAGHPRESGTKEKVKSHVKSEKEATKRECHKSNNLSAVGSHRQRLSNEESGNKPNKDTPYPDANYDNDSVNYEDDFEDYEDDFDDIDDEDEDEGGDSQEQEKEERETKEKVRKIPVAKSAEIEAIQKAINAENEKIETFLPKQRENRKGREKELKIERQESPARSPVSGKFIDFQTAKQRQSIRKIASEQK